MRKNACRILAWKPLQIDYWEHKDRPINGMDVREIVSK
jgi:hypothetical protein